MDNLQNGIAAFRAGKRDEARKYFIAAMKENPKSEQAWGWLYQVSNNDNERKTALKNVVEINPRNEKAKQLLSNLVASPFDEPQPAQSTARPQTVPQTAQKENNKTMRNVLIAAISIFVVICCLIAFSNSIGSLSTKTKIKYVISGTSQSALITYFNETGGTEQVTLALPFTKEMEVQTGAALSLVAQSNGAGTITCEIWVNGEKRKTSTSTAQYGVVTCSDFVY